MQPEREKFGAGELAVCLSHYDLGVVHTVREYNRGSRRSPKVVIGSDRGRFLLKRRPRGVEDLDRVRFSHALQQHLAEQHFPLPRLIETRDGQATALVVGERVYELFEFIEGRNYSGSHPATYHAGRTLGLFHSLLADYRPGWEPSGGSYHDTSSIRAAVGATVEALPPSARPPQEVLDPLVDDLEARYTACAAAVNDLGLPDWPDQIVHGDWHPGNMLFRGERVVAVIDYDTARRQQRTIDLAYGALQFSILGGGEDPATWPSQVEPARLKLFLDGYRSVNPIEPDELRALPLLMCEAMIAEAVLPIAATGSFGRLEGFGFLQMIQRKVRWVQAHQDQLIELLQ